LNKALVDEEEAMTRSTSDDNITIYALPGSQYCAKVLAALDAVGIAHDVTFVSFDAKKRSEELPSGGRKVPEMKVVTSSNPEESTVVQDSEGILQWFDDNRGTKFFGHEDAHTLSARAGDGILAGSVLYYNWVDDDGYARSVRKSIKDQVLPQWLPFRGKVTDLAVKSERSKFRHEASTMLSLDASQISDEPLVRQKLLDELQYFQSLLTSPEQIYLLGESPTAADFSVYAQLERLVGDTGDAEVFCSLPELMEHKELERLWRWYAHMREEHPIVFHGKGPGSVNPNHKSPRSPRSPFLSRQKVKFGSSNHLPGLVQGAA